MPNRGGLGGHGAPALSLRESLRPFGRRFLFASAYFLILFFLGTIGYVGLEGWGWFDALYMSITTVTSVGFMEVHPLSPEGRALTVVLILLGVTGLGIWWALITALIIELDLGGLLRRRRMNNKISELRDHYLVCGAGRIGRVVIRELYEEGVPFVLVEQDPGPVQRLLERYPGLLVLERDATKEETLQAAQIDGARGMAACLATDADNLLLCLTARGLKPDLTIVSRANDQESVDKLRRAGATNAISPSDTGGIRMASTLLRPSVVSFLDVATRGSDINLRLEEATIPDQSPLAGKTLAEVRIPQKTGLVVIAMRHGSGAPTYNPGPEVQLASGDTLIVLGGPDQIRQLKGYVGGG